MATFYVRRSGEVEDPWTGQREPRAGWTGPIRSPTQADREAAAWRDAGWTAEVEPSTPEVRAQVRAWQRRKRERR